METTKAYASVSRGTQGPKNEHQTGTQKESHSGKTHSGMEDGSCHSCWFPHCDDRAGVSVSLDANGTSRMKTSTGKPTKAEAERIEKMLRLGCAACAELFLWMPAEVHHLLEGNKRLGHLYSIPLCAGHHRGLFLADQALSIPKEMMVSIAHGRKEFVRHYSDERTMWERVQKRLKLSTEWPESKIVKRVIA